MGCGEISREFLRPGIAKTMEGKAGFEKQNSKIPANFWGNRLEERFPLSVRRELCPKDSGAFSLDLEPWMGIGFALAALMPPTVVGCGGIRQQDSELQKFMRLSILSAASCAISGITWV